MPVYIIGDLHGHYNDYRKLLISSGLMNEQEQWTGGTSELWLIGDFFDRGVYGIDCIELTMELQASASAEGGRVQGLLGNHEMMLLCAWKFGDRRTSGGMPVIDQWRMWGGIDSDLSRMTEEHARWLEALPAMALVGDTLLLHADAMLYVEMGRGVDAVNQAFRDLLASDDLSAWERTLRAFAEHRAFSALGKTGAQRAQQVVRWFGARRLVHGHTPIPLATGEPAESVDHAWEYAGGTCINVDGGIYLGSPGFVYELD